MANDIANNLKQPIDEEVQRWHFRIGVARQFQDTHGDTNDRWAKNIKATAGDYNSASGLGEEAIDVNMVRSTMRTRLPPLWLNEPHITVKPTTATFKGFNNIMNAEVTEVEINYWLRELETRLEVKKAVIDAESTNLGYIYLGYTKDKDDIKQGDTQVENVPTIRAKQPFVRRHAPKQVLVPPGIWDLEEAPWVDIIFFKPLRHVKAKWPETTEDLQPSLSIAEALTDGKMTGKFDSMIADNDEVGIVELHNIWDKETRKIYILAKDHDVFLEEPSPWPYKVEGFPLLLYRPETISDEYHGTPPLDYSMPQNKELNATRTAMRKRRNRTKAVIFFGGEVDEQLIEKYKQADDGEIIQTGLDGDIRQHMMIDTGIPFDGGDLAYDRVIKDDILVQDGLSAEQRGGGDPNVDSATASANIEKHGQIRAADRADGVKTLYLGIAKKLWMILKQFPNEQRSRLIAGSLAGQFASVEYTLKELEGEFAFDMDMGAVMSDNPVTRESRALMRYNLFRGDPKVDPNALILDVLKAQNIPDPNTHLLVLRSPQEELQLMLRGLPVEAHEQDDHEGHIAQHDADAEQLDQMLRQLQPETPEQGKIRFAQQLMTAHFQDHFKWIQQLTGGQQLGKPRAENLLRKQVRAAGDSETQAELTGQPLRAEDLVQ